MKFYDAVEALVNVGQKWDAALRIAAYGMVVQQYGWEGLGFSRQQVYVLKKYCEAAGVDPMAVDFSDVPAFFKRSVVAGFERSIKQRSEEQRRLLQAEAERLEHQWQNLEALGLAGPGASAPQGQRHRRGRRLADTAPQTEPA